MSYRIAEVAEMVGVPTTTLRYYEDIDLIAKPARAGNGYRRYDDADVARLRFVANAKDLGIPLDDVRQLVGAFEAEDCSSVAHHVAELVASRMAQTRAQIRDMTVLAEQLQAAADQLGDAPNGQPCDESCPCATAALDAPAVPVRPLLPQVPRAGVPRAGVAQAGVAQAPIACTLDAGALSDRLADWHGVMSAATGRDAIDGGVVVSFPADADLAARAAALAVAEQSCCAFFDFTIGIAAGALRVEVRAPAEAADAIEALLGPTS